MDIQSRFRGALLGLACGDAVGTTVEFRSRGSFPPVTDMVGGGPFSLPAGAWTDDTSMALCLATSLIERKGFDARDQMDRYVRWYETGYWSSTGSCFDIGNTVRDSLDHYRDSGDPYAGPTGERTAGNGCIMRLAPVPMFFYRNQTSALRYAVESSRTTHGATECLESCRLMAGMLMRAFDGETKQGVLNDPNPDAYSSAGLRDIAKGAYRTKSETDIRGTGYVVRSLEAAAWCVYATDNFRDAILRATNLGDDADTTAAVCGQIAGALYGDIAIPPAWVNKLVMADKIQEIANHLFELGPSAGPRNS
jgi:ADP-ribosyl-[dinitrogen reductase] hydrolase